MPTNIQYRFQQYEPVPPAGSWSIISARLDEEYDVAETRLSEKISDYAALPPLAVWDQISNLLPDETVVPVIEMQGQNRGRVIPMKFLRVAAAVLIGIAITTVYFLIPGDREAETVTSTELPEQANKVVQPQLENTDSSNSIASAVPPVASTNRSARQYARNRSNNNLPVVQASYVPGNNNEDIRYANIDDADKLEPTGSINVSSQPIRDRDGNIIMDEKLVSAPDGNYVTVTGPNGVQTKISKKFFHALSYMNADSKEDDHKGILLQEGSLWKWLFQEWRNKLLHQPSFIPTATNFLDIIELKEMLHENF